MSKFRTVRGRIAALATLGLLVVGIAAATTHVSEPTVTSACASCLNIGSAADVAGSPAVSD
jgi:hypothetical protein